MSRKTSANTGGLQTHKFWVEGCILDTGQTPVDINLLCAPRPPSDTFVPACRTISMEGTVRITAYCRPRKWTSWAMHNQEVTSNSMCGQCKLLGSSPAIDGLP